MRGSFAHVPVVDESPKSMPRPQLAQNLAAARVVGRIETKGLARRARFDQRLNDSVRRPGLSAAGFQDERNSSANAGNPKRMHTGRIVRQHDAQRFARGKKLNECPSRSPKPRSSISQSIFRVSPLSTFSMFASMLRIFSMFRRTRTCG